MSIKLSDFAPYLCNEYAHAWGIKNSATYWKRFLNCSVFWIHRNYLVKDLLKRKKPAFSACSDSDEVSYENNSDSVLLNNGFRYTRGCLTETKIISDGKITAAGHEKIMKPECFVENFKILRRFIELCRKHRFLVVLVTLPYHKAYLKEIQHKWVAQFKSEMSSILKENKDLLYFDYSEFPGINLSDYYNSNHINYIGAKKITDDLNKKIMKIIK